MTKFKLKSRINSFNHAFNGLKILIKHEHNARIHLAAALVVISLALILNISTFEWIALIFAIGMVAALEIINSSVERLANFICIEKNDQIKTIKDLGAASVLVGALVAIVIGLIVFIPHLIELIKPM